MAGSYNLLRAPDGSFSFDLIENLGDAWEACEECFHIIEHLTGGDVEKINEALTALGYPTVQPHKFRDGA